MENEEAKVLPDPPWDIRGQSTGRGGEETEKEAIDKPQEDWTREAQNEDLKKELPILF